MKKTIRKPTKKVQEQHRLWRAYKTAAEAVLFMNIEAKPVTVHVTPDDWFYRAEYAPTDFRTLLVTTVGVLAAMPMRTTRNLDRNEVYEELLKQDDPRCFFDKVSVDELMNIVTLSLWLLTSNWHLVECIAEKLLSYGTGETRLVAFAPSDYTFTK